jgi:DNA mismatch endonuclease (patch repair protein)
LKASCLHLALGAMDTLSPKERSARMARIRSKDTKPEKLVRGLAHSLGYRFRLHGKGLAGSPDLVFPSRKKVIFVHGCFWHAHGKCSVANMPKSRTDYWKEKFSRNKARDKANQRQLRKEGWEVLVVWECQTKNEAMMKPRLVTFLGASRSALRGSKDGR